ncbi:MAG TPA: hypothetical protein VLE50_11165 [Cellvibrio sp.]|nr:hypothetical protein [Cellvibrio sp.]
MRSNNGRNIPHFLRQIARLFFLLCVVIAAGDLHALPDLQSAESIGNIKIFRDHENPSVIYYFKAQKSLAFQDGIPDFSYHLNRYMGTRLTEDSNEFRVRGVIRFKTIDATPSLTYQQLLQQMRERFGPTTQLVAAPVAHSYYKLVYKTATDDAVEPEETGEISGNPLPEKKPGMVFGESSQRFTIGLSGHNADLFWQAFEKDKLILSLAYGSNIVGVKRGDNQQWLAAEYEIADAAPIQVSMNQFPILFSKNEIWQNREMAHSTITVMCYDFINVVKTHLYSVLVEVRFTTLRKQRYIEKVKFIADSDAYEVNVRFKLANNLQSGYEYRVTRMNKDGEKTVTDWMPSTQAVIDVSLDVDSVSATATATETATEIATENDSGEPDDEN